MGPPSSSSLFFFFFFVLLSFGVVVAGLASNNNNNDDDVLERLRDYLRITTVHPDPDYHAPVRFLLDQARDVGLEARVLELVPGKLLALLSWPGSDASLPSILLNSHMDVVPVESSKWTHPPFAAAMDERGDIYARGAQDTKSLGMQYVEAVRRLKSQGFAPRRSLHISFVPDEEIGGRDGAKAFVESPHFASLNVAFVLDEGLASPHSIYRVFNGERSPWWLSIKSIGSPGHGSKLFDHSALGNLLQSLETISLYREAQFDLIKAGMKADGEVVSVNPVYLRAGTPTPTGYVMNMQPSEAEAGFDIRVSPFTDPYALEKRIEEEWAPASRNMTFEFKQKVPLWTKLGSPSVTIANSSNPWWVLLDDAVTKAGGVLGKPEIRPSATDLRYIRDYGIPALGFSPIANTPVLIHDHNEFLNKQQYLKGIGIYEAIIKSFTTTILPHEVTDKLLDTDL